MVGEALTLSEAHLELLDRIGENVDIGIMLPGGVPWAGGPGVLNHQARRMVDDLAEFGHLDDETATIRRHWTELLLRRGGRDGLFMVGDFVVPLHAECVVAVRRKEGGAHPGLDFTVGADQFTLTVRVTFVEQTRDEEGES